MATTSGLRTDSRIDYSADDRHLLVLYTTETGNVVDVDERIAREAIRRHVTLRVMSMHEYPLVSGPLGFFLESRHRNVAAGQGGPNQRAPRCLRRINDRLGPRTTLDDVPMDDAPSV